MNPFTWIGNAVGGIVSPITGYFTKKSENKTKVKLSQIDRLKSADDALSEWENIMAENSGNSWKDEYVTVIVTLPIITTFLAVFYSIFTGDPTAAHAAKEATNAVKELVPEYGNLVIGVCFAAIGIKAIKK